MTTSSAELIVDAVRPAFPEKASRSLSDLRAAMTQMFSQVPGGVRKSYDVNKLLGVDARLSWQVFKLTGPGDPLALAQHVPATATMNRLLNAALNYGLSKDHVATVRQAFDAFEQLVDEHAGDRSIFDTMTRTLADDEVSQQADIAHRKGIFKGHRHYMALEYETNVTTLINYKTESPDLIDVGSIRTKIGMRRLRPEAEIVLDRPKLWNVGDQDKSLMTFDPVSQNRTISGILPEFSTRPLPRLKSYRDADGHPVTSLAGDTVGRQGQVDLVFGNVWRGLPQLSPDLDGQLGFGTHLYIASPTTNFYIDVLVPSESADTFHHRVDVFGLAPSGGNIDDIRRKHPRLPFREKLVRLSGGFEGIQIREVPSYQKLIKSFCDQLNWSTQCMEVFRLYIKYPIVGTLISVRFNSITK